MKTRFCIALLTLTVQEICGILVNVALGKKTTQLEGEETWPSSNAVDGIKECKIINSTFLTLSGKSDLPWWKLDLVELFQIHQINVFGRDDNQYNQLQGFRLYLSKDENITDSNIVYTNTASDYNNGHIVIEVNLTGLFRFVKLDLPGAYRNSGEKGPIVLCEVEILVKMTNIAVGKPATMSSTFSNMIASKCVDGNVDRKPDSCNCCSHSRSEENPWITIDLQQQQNIFQIHVFGRNDVVINNRAVTGLEIYANDTSDLLLGHNTFENSTDVIVTTPQGLHTQYITLKRPSQRPFTEWYLVVCEVEIYTRYCKPGTYGVLCQEQCGHCRQKPCEVDSGYCPNAECLEGWTGLQCKQKDCDLGYFGLNCSSVCSTHCLNNVTQCNKTTGKCMQGCETGYMGQNCTTQCMAGQFGRDCNQTCTSNCVNGYDQCSKTTGECQQGCVAGFTGLNCSTPCETGRFGVNCSSYCSIHCYQGREKCNKSSGVCMEGCDSGYKGNNCSEVCLDGHYGRNCNRTCSGHCIGGHAQCNKSTGECVKGCVPGFTGYNCFEECPNGFFGINCVGKCHCINETVCRKTDGNCSYGCAFGWSGSNCSNDLNLIKQIHENVTTNQSSIFAPNNDPNNYNSQKAIDGVQNYAIDSCNCCSVTNGDSPSWWQIDLKQKYLIGGLRIFGRESNYNEQLENAEVYAGNISTLLNPIANMTSVFTVPEMTVTRRHFTKQFEPIIAQFFLVELSKKVLTLCEFKLYVIECDIGTFGTGCMHHCHCKDKRTCNQVTGRCQTPGCLAGWQGEACENVCDDHKFGEGCNNTCNCINGTLCDHSNGTCFADQCDPGWLLPTCSKACNPRDFGDGCKNTCHCKDQTSCDHISGFCDKGLCDPGWLLPTCSKACNYRTFGDNCSATCHCFNNTSCIAATGKCDAGECDPGWTTDSCDKTCDHRTFGYNCSSTCNCINNTTCNATTGQCFLGFCESGWQGEKCDHACDHRTFGYNCSSTCNCINNTTCNATTGQCFLGFCESGWQEEKCDHACDHRTFGYNCSSTCNCINNSTCNASTGQCFLGFCESGWQGEKCDHACDHRTFGYNCSSTCNCINNSTCNASTGQCFLGFCESGWQGVKCDHACDHRTFGYNCSSTCNCINNSTCNASTGQCFLGFCESGWQGQKCDHACEHRSFGLNCSSICHCYKNTTCDKTTGECFKKLCDSGWQGTSCFQASPERAKDSTSAAVVGGTVAAVLVILAVVIGLIVLRRMRLTKRNTTKETAFSHLDRALEEKSNVQRRRAHNAHEIKSYEGEQETNMTSTDNGDYYSFNKQVTGIRIHELWDYIRSKIENNCEQLISEFRSLPQGLVHAARAADHITNRGKNRYKEMYAYDHTRVILDDDSTTGGDNTTDYINACYIDGYDKVKKFVASQGPTKNMINDFWRMVWQLKSDKIVMLTNLIEMGTIKCLQYWPKEEEGETECSFGDIVVKLLETKTYLDFNIRLFEVGKNGKAFRRIRQFHFKSWPDKDVPDSTWCLVNFWRAVDTNAASNAGPIVVHCSAGVGRTGTFIGLDNLVNQARQEGCVRPLQVVQTLRSQRVNMVQTKEQYIYLHEAVADAMYIGTHVIWTKQLKNVLEFMVHKDKNEARTRLQIQFELIEMSIENQSSDVSDSPEYSNVETLMSESDEYKPKIKKRGSKFVEQLRAMYIPNYKGKSTFLVSMSPDRDTLEEFWSLIDENNIKTVIMLTEKSSTCYQPSCELGSNSEGGARFSVNKIEEKIRKGYIQRTFTFKESGREEEDSLTTVKQFEYTAWKDGYPAPGDTASFLDMTEAVLKWQPHLSESQPLLVHCGDGFTRSGVACVLLNELQRMKYEGGHINIVESVKMMKKRQRHLISSYEQYKFCFDLIMDHINRTEVYQNL